MQSGKFGVCYAIGFRVMFMTDTNTDTHTQTPTHSGQNNIFIGFWRSENVQIH